MVFYNNGLGSNNTYSRGGRPGKSKGHVSDESQLNFKNSDGRVQIWIIKGDSLN
jgi:hypothetical protein